MQNSVNARVKLPKLKAQVEGRGNGVKTWIANMQDICRSLRVPGLYATKFFGTELGTQSTYDEKTGRAVVNGAHDPVKLGPIIEEFQKRFILCSKCGSRETNIKVDKKAKEAYIVCTACNGTSRVDPLHKFTDFIVKNPPPSRVRGEVEEDHMEDEVEDDEEEEEADKRAKKGGKKEKKRDKKTEVELVEDAPKKKKVDKLVGKTGDKKRKGGEAVELTGGINDMISQVRQIIALKKDAAPILAAKEGLSNADKVKIAFQAVFFGTDDIEVLRKRRSYKPFGIEDLMKTESSQRALLRCIFELCVHEKPDWIMFAPAFLRMFYDLGYLQEDLIHLYADELKVGSIDEKDYRLHLLRMTDFLSLATTELDNL
uniref:Translation initiation factor IF2/IF5 domain-containing protein n=1 Tax=Palpitomonas bilix TaxID=652834 RepID=A0A7S3G2K8_9EUKA|mmetsp:Transcript_23744/g.59906  ORF Transcript_23744/g.59906 Transcript_23744/m.59906 type:complete len:371 (+) Transcript_23744:451-1563(+)